MGLIALAFGVLVPIGTGRPRGGCDFQRGDFQRCDFQRCDFQRCDFQRCDFRGGDF